MTPVADHLKTLLTGPISVGGTCGLTYLVWYTATHTEWGAQLWGVIAAAFVIYVVGWLIRHG